MKKTKIFTLAAFALMLFSCDDNDNLEGGDLIEIEAKAPRYIDLGNTSRTINQNSNVTGKQSKFKKVGLYMAEYITAGGSSEMGNIVYFKTEKFAAHKQLGADFLPYFSVGSLNGIGEIRPGLTYYVDENRPSTDIPISDSNSAINKAMDTWDDVTCSELGLIEIPFDSRPTGYIAALLSEPEDIVDEVNYGGLGIDYGGTYDWAPADVVHNGWLPSEAFDFIFGPNSGVLGVTFTITFRDANGNEIDDDNNGKADVAWREIYYNEAYDWAIDGSHYDVETIALHEAGHGLSQGHFGKLFYNPKKDRYHFAPRAVMNAGYTGIQQSIDETDEAGHCSNWGAWPNN